MNKRRPRANDAASLDRVVPAVPMLPPDWRLSLTIANLVGRACSLVTAISRAGSRLEPLDQVVGHDKALSAEELDALGIEPGWDELRTAIGLACGDLQHAVSSSARALAHVKGLLRGDLKHQYEELMARRVRANQDTLDKLRAFESSYNVPATPFAIRQLALSSLTEECQEVAAHAVNLLRNHGDASADFRQELDGCITKLNALRTALSKLRDNPSRKMADPIAQCHTQANEIWSNLNRVMDDAKARSGRHF